MTGRCGKRGKMGKNKFFSVLGGVAEVGITLGYIVFSMLFLIFGYEDYPLNRNWIVPIGCFFAIAAFHFLAGMVRRCVYGKTGGKFHGLRGMFAPSSSADLPLLSF